jgi:hypothetical protein
MIKLCTCVHQNCNDDNFDESLNELNMSPKVALEYLTKIHKSTTISSLSHEMTGSRENKRKLSIKIKK